ncbi:hypothetical protein GCM10008090_14610 [Arenicella chitinivorans]|uniref:Uncharacterized protein n=1 Tax=Arenicella chitinivorans TaxID=1329800 RepID=A0A918RR58_9GAMM|nr:hypothetical protein [Arenicella chitinivorans]GHA06049.1 hypothetical protein GCM10008090_14610 [Arenicella chitinivorans]
MHIKTSIFVALLTVTIACVVQFCSYTSALSPNNEFCKKPTVKRLAPWTAGCVYQAYFEQNPALETVLDEANRLANFAQRNGKAADVLWYRSVFHQRFQNELRTSYQDIHGMHLQYTRAQHIRIDLQMNYLQFLLERDLAPLAQATLDKYCATYIPQNRRDLIEEINWRIDRRGLKLSSTKCEARVGS